MKKTIFHILCAFALLSLVGCAEDITVPTEVNPASSPDAYGMVSFRLAVENEAYQDGYPQTRSAQEEPIQFVQEMSDGYTLISELTPAPATVSTRAPLETGTKVLMIVFDDKDNPSTQDDSPIGYQQITVSETGSLGFDLPVSDTKYRLVFYTENSSTDFTVSEFVGGDTQAIGNKGVLRGDRRLSRRQIRHRHLGHFRHQ
ncbi:MAG: hypothetical protein LBN29_10075 [Mediterranea sp.]|nr:hypothetical protein [Mediterranea sp.]